MGLSHLKFQTYTVSLGEDGEFSVRGLSIEDVTPLIYNHRDALEKLFLRVKSQDENDMLDIARTLVDEAPLLAAEIIAHAADDATPEGIKIARKIPAPAQIEAIDAVGRLTFRTEASLKNLLEVIVRVASNATKAMKAAA